MRLLHNSFRQIGIYLFHLNHPFTFHKLSRSLLHIPRKIYSKNLKFLWPKQLCNSLNMRALHKCFRMQILKFLSLKILCLMRPAPGELDEERKDFLAEKARFWGWNDLCNVLNMSLKITATLMIALTLISCEKKIEKIKSPPSVLTVIAEAKDTPIMKSYVGHVQAYVQVEVKSQVEGVLTGYYFTEGQEVKEGDLLFTIDSRPYEAQLAKAQGMLAESIANLRLSEDTVRRYSKLAQEDYVTQLQYDEYLTNVAKNKAEIDQNKADIESAKINISYCNIHASIEAVTGKLQIQQGNLIKNAGDSPLILLNQIAPIYVYFSVPQNDLPQIMRAHRKSPLNINSILAKDYSHPYTGVLDLIDNQIDEGTGSLWLRGIFTNEERMLWPGEFTDVQLILRIQKNAVLIPVEAAVLGQKGRYAYVIKKDGTADYRTLTLGDRYKDDFIVLKGIEAGEEVVTDGQINLTPGEKVSIKKS